MVHHGESFSMFFILTPMFAFKNVSSNINIYIFPFFLDVLKLHVRVCNFALQIVMDSPFCTW